MRFLKLSRWAVASCNDGRDAACFGCHRPGNEPLSRGESRHGFGHLCGVNVRFGRRSSFSVGGRPAAADEIRRSLSLDGTWTSVRRWRCGRAKQGGGRDARPRPSWRVFFCRMRVASGSTAGYSRCHGIFALQVVAGSRRRFPARVPGACRAWRIRRRGVAAFRSVTLALCAAGVPGGGVNGAGNVVVAFPAPDAAPRFVPAACAQLIYASGTVAPAVSRLL